MITDDITPEHSYARIEQMLADLEALRLEMGRSRDARVPMHVTNASPREVFYHAQTVYRKANRLCVELGAASVDPRRASQPARASPSEVLVLLEGTRERLACARAMLRIEGDEPPPDLPGPLVPVPGKNASDVLAGCLVASRQLNAMLEHAFVSRDGREQLLRALGLAERLLEFNGAALPPAPPLERRKFPRDVFQVLWQTCELQHRLLSDSGVAALDIHRGYVGEEPTDVYDLASLIVSELEYLASVHPIGEPRQHAATPAPILPAHNFRLARQLQAAIGLLAEVARARPDWLRAPASPPAAPAKPGTPAT
jgi:hypothetical protein